jgi:hypothetical protein
MFDPTKFDAVLKKAQEFDKVMSKFMSNTGLPMIDATLRTLSDTSKEAGKLLRVLDDIKNDFKIMALEAAKMTRAELEQVTKFQKRRDIMDQILVNIKKQNRELSKQHSESKADVQNMKQRLQLEQGIAIQRIKNMRYTEQMLAQQVQLAKTADDRLEAEERLFAQQDKINAVIEKYNKLQEKTQKQVDKQIEKQKKLKEIFLANKKAADEVPGMKKANDAAEAAEQRARRVKFLKSIGGNMFSPVLEGLGLDKLKFLFSGLSGIMLGLAAIVGVILMRIVKDAIDAAKTLKNSGMTYAQTKRAFGQVGDVLETGKDQGVAVTREDFAKAFNAQAAQFGSVNAKTLGPQSIIDVAETMRVYGLGADEAARLQRNIGRANGYSKTMTHNVYETVKAFAKVNDLNPADVMKDLAENSEAYARYASRGAQSLLEATTRARQLGVTLESTETFANRLVDDFEGSLKMQAELQTVIPGIDLSGVTYAAQFGGPEQIQHALESAFGAAGLQRLSTAPRSIQNLISRSTGMSLSDIQGLSTGTPTNQTLKTPGLSDLDTAADKAANSLSALAANGDALMAFIRAPGQAGASSNTGAALRAPTGARAGVKSAGVKHTGGIVGDGPFRTVSSSVYEGAPRYHKGFLPDEVPAILQRGEAVLSHVQLDGLTQLMNLTQTLGGLGASVQKIPHSKTDIASRMFGGGRVAQAQGLLGGGRNIMSHVSSISNFLGGGSGGLMQAVSGGASKLMGGGLMQAVSGGASNLMGGGLAKLAGLALGGPLGGLATSLLGGKLGSVVSMGSKAISGIGNAIGGLFGHKKKAAPPPVQQGNPIANLLALAGMGGSTPSPSGQSNVEKLLQDLISAVKSEKDVYLDGKKVTDTLLSSNSRG